ncbi:MAG: hypothetical protein JW881_00480 [Spirochaetales bacterium]|nr:hypothetical protein [Spirochaetales bacterium]
MIYSIIRRYGIKAVVAAISIVTVVVSGLITVVSLYIAFGEFILIGFLISTIVPALIAPPQVFVYLHSIVKQKQVEDELRKLNASMEEIIEKRTEKLESALKEKETLINEIHHRVKNNLQVVVSLMKLKSKSFFDKRDKEICRDIEEKIRAMALVHEQLYGEKNHSKIGLKSFISRLISNVVSTYEPNANIDIVQDTDDVQLGLDAAIPLSIIVTEILSNSFKHAFPHGNGGTIHVRMKRQDGTSLIAEMWDSGVGCENDISQSMGFRIIHALVRQLDGTMEINIKNGVRFAISFPI